MNNTKRYNSFAIGLHWLIAIFLVALLGMGKYMTQLPESDPLRFTLTQWHKSIGIVVLLLAVVRVVWRVTHKPPDLPVSTARFERIGSHITHSVLYVLMVVIPVSGWVMVSASPLNLETLLFGAIPWPHLPYVSSMPDKQLLADRTSLLHLWLANTMLLLVILHVSGALFHQFIRRDQLISRMLITAGHWQSGDLNHGLLAGVLIASAAGLFLVNANAYKDGFMSGGVTPAAVVGEDVSAVVPATAVSFTAMQLGEPVNGKFTDLKAELSLDEGKPEMATLKASVVTASVDTGDSQLDATVVTSDWFSSDEFPEATFSSTSVKPTQDSAIYEVTGNMTIKGQTKSVAFDLLIDEGVGRGEFPINRGDFGVGDDGQDEFVDPEVVIRFVVQVNG